MADLETPRPEVKEALDWFVARRHFGTNGDGHLKTIRAELVRLAEYEQAAGRLAVEKAEFRQRAEKAEAELAESRETIKRLNRRVQVAEAGVAERVKVSAPGSLGRGLANAAADAFMHERDEARAELAALKTRIANSCRADGQRVFDLLGLPIEYDGTLALVKVED